MSFYNPNLNAEIEALTPKDSVNNTGFVEGTYPCFVKVIPSLTIIPEGYKKSNRRFTWNGGGAQEEFELVPKDEHDPEIIEDGLPETVEVLPSELMVPEGYRKINLRFIWNGSAIQEVYEVVPKDENNSGFVEEDLHPGWVEVTTSELAVPEGYKKINRRINWDGAVAQEVYDVAPIEEEVVPEPRPRPRPFPVDPNAPPEPVSTPLPPDMTIEEWLALKSGNTAIAGMETRLSQLLAAAEHALKTDGIIAQDVVLTPQSTNSVEMSGRLIQLQDQTLAAGLASRLRNLWDYIAPLIVTEIGHPPSGVVADWICKSSV